mgnify:CR=1 FL=1
MKTAIACSILFLAMYVAYHMTSESTKFGGEGAIKTVYFVILISHIVLSIAVIPFVLITFVRAITNNIEEKIEKGLDPLGRSNILTTVPLDDSFPEYILNNQDKYMEFIKP